MNEQLYTTTSEEAAKLFKEDPSLFADYHEGYRQQVEKWPKNPLDILIDELKKPKYLGQAIGDFGCGEGRLQIELEAAGHTKVHSFDVGKAAPHVIQTDISHVPLESNVLDVGVFCLSLMGTNFPAFLREANRVIRPGGKLFVAEVVSRFPDSDCKSFLKCMKEQAGFQNLKVAKLKDFFFVMVFDKEKRKLGPLQDDFAETLKPCLYKKR